MTPPLAGRPYLSDLPVLYQRVRELEAQLSWAEGHIDEIEVVMTSYKDEINGPMWTLYEIDKILKRYEAKELEKGPDASA